MKISSVESVEGLPDSYTAVVPITDQSGETSAKSSEVGVVSIVTGNEEMRPANIPGEVKVHLDPNESIHEWLSADPGLADVQAYGDSINLYRSMAHALSSSTVRGPAVSPSCAQGGVDTVPSEHCAKGTSAAQGIGLEVSE